MKVILWILTLIPACLNDSIVSLTPPWSLENKENKQIKSEKEKIRHHQKSWKGKNDFTLDDRN